MDSTAAVVMRAWKDEAFRASLTEEQRAAIPPRPDNFERLTDEQLEEAAGATAPVTAILGMGGLTLIGGAVIGWGARGLSDS